MEMGTDLWDSEGKEVGFTRYDSNMNTNMGTLKVLWNGFYASINYCNTAIYYAPMVQGYASEEELNAKLAEAYFLRGWSNWHIVEQFGKVVLRTEPSSIYWIKNNQKWPGDVPIIRLGEIYLVAAEAALRYNNDQATTLKYVQPIRNRAAVTGRQAEMAVSQSDMTLDFILAEQARELSGEQVRWYDMKRHGKLTKEYLAKTNPNILNFDNAKHQVRPIPQSYLDAIANAAEFGNNGY
ncbi:MAG: RagB/SusD family nutrient uptake outer membrane protein [Alistipes sp.]|nr:RagB/SusD family nutrient uptake outer membrane protein [Alistipes sp.]